MPELPEVETIRRGIAPWLVGERIAGMTVREPRLRFGIAPELPAAITGRRVLRVDRRSKYLLITLDDGTTLLLHLGMSGRLHVLPEAMAPAKHDHYDLLLGSGAMLRYHDPRRFGFIDHISGPPDSCRWLRALGPEPLGSDFNGAYLYARLRGRSASIKSLLMDAHIVVGVGNIYAQEALFLAGIRPGRAAGRLSLPDCQRLVDAVQRTLRRAVEAGGTTLRDFSGADGRPGYFQQDLHVYGRAEQPCRRCGKTLRASRITGRSSVWCAHCQPR